MSDSNETARKLAALEKQKSDIEYFLKLLQKLPNVDMKLIDACDVLLRQINEHLASVSETRWDALSEMQHTWRVLVLKQKPFKLKKETTKSKKPPTKK